MSIRVASWGLACTSPVNSAISPSAPRASAPLRTLGFSSASRAEVPGHNALLCPHVLTPPPAQSPAAFMVFCYCGGSSLGWCRRGWALGTGTGADRPWSAVSMQVTSAGTATRPARLCTEWRRSWAPGSLRRVPSSPHTTCFLPNKPLGGIQVGGIFSCSLNQLLFWSHIRSPAKPWTQERPVPRSTAGASRGFRRQSGWGVRASESEAKRVFRKSTGPALQPLQGSPSYLPNPACL